MARVGQTLPSASLWAGFVRPLLILILTLPVEGMNGGAGDTGATHRATRPREIPPSAEVR